MRDSARAAKNGDATEGKHGCRTKSLMTERFHLRPRVEAIMVGVGQAA
jgi:hypothetical protein